MRDFDKYAFVRKGMLEFVVLQTVSASKVYVAEILQRLQNTEFATQEGTLYPLLSRLCRDGMLAYEWYESESGPPRKYYKLTAAGRKHLSEFREYWVRLTDLVERLGQSK